MDAPRPLSPLERICAEVHSKCATLRSASRLLGGLSVRESEEMLVLMAEEAHRLAESLDAHRTAPSVGIEIDHDRTSATDGQEAKDMDKGMQELQAVLGSLSGQCIKDAKQTSDAVSEQYNTLGHGPRLNMIAYDDLA